MPLITTETLEAALAPALDALFARYDEHQLVVGLGGRCSCGWQPSARGANAKSYRRAFSIHETAARRRADKVYKAESDAILADLHRRR